MDAVIKQAERLSKDCSRDGNKWWCVCVWLRDYSSFCITGLHKFCKSWNKLSAMGVVHYMNCNILLTKNVDRAQCDRSGASLHLLNNLPWCKKKKHKNWISMLHGISLFLMLGKNSSPISLPCLLYPPRRDRGEPPAFFIQIKGESTGLCPSQSTGGCSPYFIPVPWMLVSPSPIPYWPK